MAATSTGSTSTVAAAAAAVTSTKSTVNPHLVRTANAIWRAIQRIPDDPTVYSDPAQLTELPFPFPGAMPFERFDLHDPSAQTNAVAATFTYMGRTRFHHLLDQIPIPPSVRLEHAEFIAQQAQSQAQTSAGGNIHALPDTSTGPVSASSESAPSQHVHAAAATVTLPSTDTLPTSTISMPMPMPSQSEFDFFPPIPKTSVFKRPRHLFLYGTIGWGKSHLLAALVCLLMRKGRKVVYIPDCLPMVNAPVVHFRSALLLTFASDADIQREVMALRNMDQIVEFCDRFPDLTYVFDQYNALEEDTLNDSHARLTVKVNMVQIIDVMTTNCAVVKAASANNSTARSLNLGKQMNFKIETFFGGMDEVETQHWYRHNACLLEDDTIGESESGSASGADIDGLSDRLLSRRRHLEDMTGRIPLYLHYFVGCTASTFDATWHTKLASASRPVYDHIYRYHSDLKDHRKEKWNSHMRVIRTFLRGGYESSYDYDHRYMYVDAEGFAHIACGLVRDCLSAVIRQLDGDSHFVDSDLLENIEKTTNPSVRGFLIEQACLTYIRTNGLLCPEPIGLLKPDKTVYFSQESNELSKLAQARTVLYIPQPWNYPAIDAIIRRVTFGRNAKGDQVPTKVELVPIQVTMSASHKPSPASFYPRHQVWLSDVSALPCQHMFVWLRRDGRPSISHSRDPRLRQQSTVIPAFQEVTVTFKTLAQNLHDSTVPHQEWNVGLDGDATGAASSVTAATSTRGGSDSESDSAPTTALSSLSLSGRTKRQLATKKHVQPAHPTTPSTTRTRQSKKYSPHQETLSKSPNTTRATRKAPIG